MYLLSGSLGDNQKLLWLISLILSLSALGLMIYLTIEHISMNNQNNFENKYYWLLALLLEPSLKALMAMTQVNLIECNVQLLKIFKIEADNDTDTDTDNHTHAESNPHVTSGLINPNNIVLLAN